MFGKQPHQALEDVWVFSVATLRGLAIERLYDADKARLDRAFNVMKAARREAILKLVNEARKGR